MIHSSQHPRLSEMQRKGSGSSGVHDDIRDRRILPSPHGWTNEE